MRQVVSRGVLPVAAAPALGSGRDEVILSDGSGYLGRLLRVPRPSPRSGHDCPVVAGVADGEACPVWREGASPREI